MSSYSRTVGHTVHRFPDLKSLLAKATPARSGDELAGIAATSAQERVAAQMTLADLALETFLSAPLIPYEADEVTRLILDGHDKAAFAPIRDLTVGEFRDWLLSYEADGAALARLAPGLTPEMVAAVSKLMRIQDLVLVAAKCRVVSRFRNTLGLPGRLSTRLQPNHPTDDPERHRREHSGRTAVWGGRCGDRHQSGVRQSAASDRRCYGCSMRFAKPIDIPTQSCVLTHVSTTIEAIERGAPVDLVFQSIAGTQSANASFGVTLGLLAEANQAARELERGTLGSNVMYFETGQGSALSANAHHGVDQQTLEARAYAVAQGLRAAARQQRGRLHRAGVS